MLNLASRENEFRKISRADFTGAEINFLAKSES
jgi:hypothetical protein